jgi:hypothetical protein
MLVIIEWNLVLETFSGICKLLPCLEQSDQEPFFEFMKALRVGTVFSIHIIKNTGYSNGVYIVTAGGS